MKKIKISIISLTLLCSPAIGQDLTSAFGVGATIGSTIDQLKESANEIAHNAGNEFGRGAFSTRQNAEILIQQLNAMSIELEGKTFNDLNNSQRMFFLNTKNTLDEINKSTKYSVNRAQQLVVQADSMLGTLPGANRTSRVLDFSPRYILSDRTNLPITVNVTGSWLGSGDPKLIIDGSTCFRLQKTESKLIFQCKFEINNTSDNVSFQKLNLTTYDRPSWLESITQFFGSSPKKRKYELALAIVPKKIGSFSGIARTMQDIAEERSKSQEFRNDNEHCQGTRTYVWTANIDNTDGWHLAAPPTTRLLSDSDATNEGIQAWSASGFVLQGKAKNSGSCAPKIFGHRAYVDGRGHVLISAKWTESRIVKKYADEAFEIGQIEWGVERTIRIPENSIFASVSSKLLNGDKFEDTSTDSASRLWYRINFDISNHRIVIRPADLETALSEN